MRYCRLDRKALQNALVKRVEVAVAVIEKMGQILICQRLPGSSYAGYWEFPGGKRELAETPQECAIREVSEELGIGIRCIRRLDTLEHQYPNALVTIHAFLCEHLDGEPQALQVAQFRWIDPGDLDQYQFPEANGPLLEKAKALSLR